MTLLLKIDGKTLAHIPASEIAGIRFAREDGSIPSISECALMLSENARNRMGSGAQWFYSDDLSVV